MADVYLAHDVELNQFVALKLVEEAPDKDTCEAIQAERRGATLQRQLAKIDAHVVEIYDSGDVDGFFYIAMEYIEGQDLSELLELGPLQMEQAVEVARAVARTLDNAHNLKVAIDGKNFHGIVHGDIKPKNVRIDRAGKVHLLDFGIAKALSLTRRLTRNEFGSVPYASPERLETGEVNVHSDLWSLAVMLYEMMAGVQPYRADSTGRLDRIIRSRTVPAPLPSSCPQALRRILVKAMAPLQNMRHQSAREFDQDLAALRHDQPLRAVTHNPEATRRTADTKDARTRRTMRSKETDAAPTRQTNQVLAGQPARPEPRKRTITSSEVVAVTLILLFVVCIAGWFTMPRFSRWVEKQLSHSASGQSTPTIAQKQDHPRKMPPETPAGNSSLIEPKHNSPAVPPVQTDGSPARGDQPGPGPQGSSDSDVSKGSGSKAAQSESPSPDEKVWSRPVNGGDTRFHLVACRIRDDKDIGCFFNFTNSSKNDVVGLILYVSHATADGSPTPHHPTAELTDQFGNHLNANYCQLEISTKGFDDCIMAKRLLPGGTVWGMVGFRGGDPRTQSIRTLRVHCLADLKDTNVYFKDIPLEHNPMEPVR